MERSAITTRTWRGLLALGLTVFLVAASAPAPTSECARATAWVATHSSALPRDYEGIAALPLSYRKAVYAALSTEERVALWRSHLERQMKTVALSGRQRQVLATVVAQLPQLVGSRDQASPDTLTALVKKTFGLRLATQIFATLGPTEELSGAKGRFVHEASVISFAWDLIDAADRLTREATTGRARYPNCNCSTSSDWCGGQTSCLRGGTTDCILVDGCGTLWQYQCDGMCYLEM